MTDDIQDPKPETPDAGPAAATEAPPAAPDADGDAPAKLRQTVEMSDVGPCRKYIRVTVSREDIAGRVGTKIKDLVGEAAVPGFRPGKAPKKIIEKRFLRDVQGQVKTEILLASLEQLAEEQDIAPLSPPNLDPAKIDMPADGPLVYEFEVEVRPEFDVPNYKNLKLKKPVYTFTDEDLALEERRVMAPYGQAVPKPEGNAGIGDILVADMVTRDGDRLLGEVKEASFRVDKRLAFKDGVAERFGEQVKGANAGDTRAVDVVLGQTAADPALRGKTVQATFQVKDVKTLRLPEYTADFLGTFGVNTPESLRELIKVSMERRLEHAQRTSARKQVMEQIAATANWELPHDLLVRQARRSLQRRIMEMRADGLSEEEINGRVRLMQQDVLQSTAGALKEHFVLQKIAETEKIEVDDDDLEEEIERLADSTGESPRRVRSRLEKEDLLDVLAAEMIERKTLDLILESAEYEEVQLKEPDDPNLSRIEEQAVPGEMHDPAAALPEAADANAPGTSEPPAEPKPQV